MTRIMLPLVLCAAASVPAAAATLPSNVDLAGTAVFANPAGTVRRPSAALMGGGALRWPAGWSDPMTPSLSETGRGTPDVASIGGAITARSYSRAGLAPIGVLPPSGALLLGALGFGVLCARRGTAKQSTG